MSDVFSIIVVLVFDTDAALLNVEFTVRLETEGHRAFDSRVLALFKLIRGAADDYLWVCFLVFHLGQLVLLDEELVEQAVDLRVVLGDGEGVRHIDQEEAIDKVLDRMPVEIW